MSLNEKTRKGKTEKSGFSSTCVLATTKEEEAMNYFKNKEVVVDTEIGSVRGQLLSSVYLEGPHHTPELVVLHTCDGLILIRDFIVIKESR